MSGEEGMGGTQKLRRSAKASFQKVNTGKHMAVGLAHLLFGPAAQTM